MIEKNEIMTLAKGLSLSPDTIEKDYVLGWLLWGIHQDNDLSQSWYFKGGTSLKKCFFETFRFSEDLDFTIKDTSPLSVDFLHKKFNQITEKIYEETGIQFFPEQFKFKVILKDKGKFSAQGTIHYNGPLRRRQGFASVKLDLTNNEIVVMKPYKRKVHHPYSDEPKEGIWSVCYSFEEVIAEKIRALVERARPRDLYDVIHFFRNRRMIENPQLVYNVLTKKCSYKKIPVPNYSSLEAHEKLEELHAQWGNMLAHQLPSLPPLESFWQELAPFFDWLEGNLKEAQLVASSEFEGEIFQPGRVTSAFSVDAVIQKIQFAAANRICIELTYHDKERIVEPLSFRRSKSGNRLFYGYDRKAAKTEGFLLSNVQNVVITHISYRERLYPIEINASGYVAMPSIRRNKQ